MTQKRNLRAVVAGSSRARRNYSWHGRGRRRAIVFRCWMSALDRLERKTDRGARCGDATVAARRPVVLVWRVGEECPGCRRPTQRGASLEPRCQLLLGGPTEWPVAQRGASPPPVGRTCPGIERPVCDRATQGAIQRANEGSQGHKTDPHQ